MIRRSVFVLAAFAVAVAGVSTAAAATSRGASENDVRVTAKDYSFVLSRKSVPHGRVEFVIKNAGQTTHDFEIAGHVSKMIQPGKSTTMYVQLKAGRYPYKCTVDSHMKLGMKGVLRVT
jgi:plastocyanin